MAEHRARLACRPARRRPSIAKQLPSRRNGLSPTGSQQVCVASEPLFRCWRGVNRPGVRNTLQLQRNVNRRCPSTKLGSHRCGSRGKALRRAADARKRIVRFLAFTFQGKEGNGCRNALDSGVTTAFSVRAVAHTVQSRPGQLTDRRGLAIQYRSQDTGHGLRRHGHSFHWVNGRRLGTRL